MNLTVKFKNIFLVDTESGKICLMRIEKLVIESEIKQAQGHLYQKF